MSESILNSIKKVLGIGEEDTSFDIDVIMAINSVFSDLSQIGVGPELGFEIEDATITWDAFLVDNPKLNSVKTYMYFRCRLIFDPPTNQAAITAMQSQIDKLEWRLNVTRESTDWIDPRPVFPVTYDIFE